MAFLLFVALSLISSIYVQLQRNMQLQLRTKKIQIYKDHCFHKRYDYQEFGLIQCCFKTLTLNFSSILILT